MNPPDLSKKSFQDPGLVGTPYQKVNSLPSHPDTKNEPAFFPKINATAESSSPALNKQLLYYLDPAHINVNKNLYHHRDVPARKLRGLTGGDLNWNETINPKGGSNSSITLPKICCFLRKQVKKTTKEQIQLPKHTQMHHRRKLNSEKSKMAALQKINLEEEGESQMEINSVTTKLPLPTSEDPTPREATYIELPDDRFETLSEHSRQVISQAESNLSPDRVAAVLNQCLLDKMNINIELKQVLHSEKRDQIIANLSSKIEKRNLDSSLKASTEALASYTSDEEAEEPLNPRSPPLQTNLDNPKVEAIKILPQESQEVSTIHLAFQKHIFENIEKAKEVLQQETSKVDPLPPSNLISNQKIKSLKANLMGDHIERKLMAYLDSDLLPETQEKLDVASEESSWLQNKLIHGMPGPKDKLPKQQPSSEDASKRIEAATCNMKRKEKKANNKLANYIKFQNKIHTFISNKAARKPKMQVCDSDLEEDVIPCAERELVYYKRGHHLPQISRKYDSTISEETDKKVYKNSIINPLDPSQAHQNTFKFTEIKIEPKEPYLLQSSLTPKPKREPKNDFLSKALSQDNDLIDAKIFSSLETKNDRSPPSVSENKLGRDSKKAKLEVFKMKSIRRIDRQCSYGKIDETIETCLVPSEDDSDSSPLDNSVEVQVLKRSKEEVFEKATQLRDLVETSSTTTTSAGYKVTRGYDISGMEDHTPESIKTILNEYDQSAKSKYKIDKVKVQTTETLSQLNKALFALQSKDLLHSPSPQPLQNASSHEAKRSSESTSHTKTSRYIVLVMFKEISF